jgi:2-phosphoglycerate kinase
MQERFIEYNKAWEAGKVEKPLSVLVGGHVGTGKSTFAKVLERHISPIYPIPTGVIRAIQQANTSPDAEPYLFAHSYELHNLVRDESLTVEERAVKGFQTQAGIVEKGIINILRFSETEGQQYIIDGNHNLPSFSHQQADKKNIVSLFFQTTDVDQYARMISGPTHKRHLTDTQLRLVRHIHDYIAEEAKNHNQPLFEYNQTDEALAYIAQRLESLIP